MLVIAWNMLASFIGVYLHFQQCVRYNQAVDISLYLKFCLCRIPVYSGFGLDVFHYNVKMFTMLYYKWSCLFFFYIRSRIFNGNRVGIDELVLYNDVVLDNLLFLQLVQESLAVVSLWSGLEWWLFFIYNEYPLHMFNDTGQIKM
jgi:hypothetical protein